MTTRTNKYELTGSLLRGWSGSLLDAGARDKRLRSDLPASIHYISADITPGCDIVCNLEQPLRHLNDRQFGFVAALDVLEHVENIHAAYRELLRITKARLFVSLPNMSNLSFRLNFLATGRLSAKYDLLVEHQGDRHRWLTCYEQMNAFIHHHAREHGFTVKQFDIISGYGRMQKIVSLLPLPASLRTYTVFYEITRI